jgi:hypothetical protein
LICEWYAWGQSDVLRQQPPQVQGWHTLWQRLCNMSCCCCVGAPGACRTPEPSTARCDDNFRGKLRPVVHAPIADPAAAAAIAGSLAATAAKVILY